MTATLLYSFLFLAIVLVVVNGQSFTTVCDSSHKCLHGGSCEKGIIEGSGESIQVCNCAKAIDVGGNRYTGLYCEHQALKAESIEEMEDDERICNSNGDYCLNGGRCRDVDLGDQNFCGCTDEYTGVHCEIEKSHDVIQKLSNRSGECTMECSNGGKCQFGINEEFEYEYEQNNNGKSSDRFYQHCVCRKGFFGLGCENNIETYCGSDGKQCTHGGKCVDLYTVGPNFMGSVNFGASIQTSEERYVCDCSQKQTSVAAYAGRYCEVKSTSICMDSQTDFNGKQFCTNYGNCDEYKKGLFTCECPAGYHGDHCEFSAGGDEPIVPEEKQCTKTVCQNGGMCKLGKKDHGVLSDMIQANPQSSLSLLIPDNNNDNYEHCVCPEGYAGTHCEHQAEVCPHGKKICFHGSKCIKNEEEDYGYSCSCNEGRINYDDDRVYGDGGMHVGGADALDDDGLGDDEVDENLFSNYYQGAGAENGKPGNIDDDEDRRSLQQGFEGQVDLGGNHCQFKATSRCAKGQSCFNGGDCYQDRCLCRNGFKGPFCEYTKNDVLVSKRPKYNNNYNQQPGARSSPKRRHHSTIVLFSFSLAFLGIAFVLLVVAYTRIRVESGTDNDNNQRQMMEALTMRTKAPNRTPEDVAATYLPFPSSSGGGGGNLDHSHNTDSGSMSPEEEKTVAELI